MTKRPTTKAELAARLRDVADQLNGDPEVAHATADQLLIDYINDPAVAAAYASVEAWYA